MGVYFQASPNLHFTNPFWIYHTPLNKREKQQLALETAALSCRWQLHRLQWNYLRFGLTRESKQLLWATELYINMCSMHATCSSAFGEIWRDLAWFFSWITSVEFPQVNAKLGQYCLMSERQCLHSLQDGRGSSHNLQNGYQHRHCTLTTVILHSINVFLLVLSLFSLIGWISGLKILLDIFEVRRLMFRDF